MGDLLPDRVSQQAARSHPPYAVVGVEQALVGQSATVETIRGAAEHAADGTSPTSDGNADTDYRENLARVLTGRALAAAGV
ncbi:MAG: hypothetical protein DLM61_12900 [Pseudonocardiales bacterium]|nr:MAG: hypothetical protein DLM61_12900 [Pseudonocardiales bacterium]